MDLGAFLKPGKAHTAFFILEEEALKPGLTEKAKGCLVGRKGGRYSWLSPVAYPHGRTLLIFLELEGFSLAPDKSLRPASEASEKSAPLTLLGRAKAARPLAGASLYALKLELLGRVT